MTWTKGKSGNPRGKLPRNIPDYILRLVINAERSIGDGKRLEDLAQSDPKWFYEKIWCRMSAALHAGAVNIAIDNRTQTQNVMMALPKVEQSIIDEVVRTRMANLTRNITFHGPEVETKLLEAENAAPEELLKDDDAELYDAELLDAITVRQRDAGETPPPKPAAAIEADAEDGGEL